MPDTLSVEQAPVTEAIKFFDLSRELRDLIYSHLFEAVYTQIRVDARLRNLQLDQPNGGFETEPSPQLAVLQASRRVWEEGSRALYGDNLFRIHAGSTIFDTTLLTRRNGDLMQNIEIYLYSGDIKKSVRVLQLLGASQSPRKSCLIKLQFREPELLNTRIIEALKHMTGFKRLVFQVDVPGVIRSRHSYSPKLGASIPWYSGLLAWIQASLTPALGPSTYTNDRESRCLTFNPKDHKN